MNETIVNQGILICSLKVFFRPAVKPFRKWDALIVVGDVQVRIYVWSEYDVKCVASFREKATLFAH